jgi:diguanylate cyclase (GGDEF)-like protein/PAS domain S-box-containing protein
MAIVLCQAALAYVSLETLSSVRAYIAGEGLWTKGQKDAIQFLTLYAETGEPRFYDQYRSAIAIPLSDRAARRALERTPADLDAARQGFLGGGNHPEDIGDLIWLYRRLHAIGYLTQAMASWAASDPVLDELVALSDDIRADRALNGAAADGARHVAQIIDINRRLTALAKTFSETLGEGARAVGLFLVLANVAAALLLAALTISRFRYFLRQRQMFEDALRAEKERAQVMLASLGDAVISTDADGRVLYMNAAAERLTGRCTTQAHGAELKSLFRIVSPETGRESEICALPESETVALHSQLMVRPDATSVAVSVVATPLRANGRGAGNVVVLHDKSGEQDFIDRLSWQASHDELTELLNRREFSRGLQGALERLSEHAGRHALMFIDLDQFKIVNDTCGHAAGDALLRMVAAELRKHLRGSDLLARLGGDEFAVLMENCEAEDAATIAERVRRAVQQLSFVWNERNFNVSASIGLAHLAEPDTTIQEALRTADVACYLAKEKGRNRVEIHQPSDSELLRRVGEMNWVQQIHDALEHDRFCLHVQEIVALKAEADAGLRIEVLLRLRDPAGRMILPGAFMPAAERYDLMPLIDRWVVRRTLETLARRLRDARGPAISSCALNLSGATFSDAGFVDFVHEQLRIHRIPPEVICFELTETSAVGDVESARRFIGALKEIGCRFSLDDFGAGLSSFGFLKHLPVDYLKIDGSFVKDMLTDPVARAMVEMINHIGKVMNKETIAEFVEDDDVVTALRDIGVDYAQGYAFGTPRPFEALSDRQSRVDLAVA